MTIAEVIFALFMFVLSGTASSFALTSVTLQSRTFEQMHAVHDAEQIIVADWFAHKPLPEKWKENGVTCVITSRGGDGNHSGIKTIQFESGQVSQEIWFPVD